MIKVTHLNNREFFINSDLILFIERTPDTLVVMSSGAKIMIRERVEEVIDRVIDFRRRIFSSGEAQLNVLRHQLSEPEPAGA